MQPAPSGTHRSLEINASGQAVLHHYGASWTAYTPSPAIAIVGAYTPPSTVYVDCNLSSDGFSAAFDWSGGSQRIRYTNGCNSSGFGYGNGINQGIPPSRYFGWGVICSSSPHCTPSTTDLLGIDGIRLTADEQTGPYLNAVPASNLWYANSWVRGSWPVTLSASDPSGVCGLLTAMDGKLVASWADPAPDTSRFVQCHGSQLPGQLDTAGYADGQHTLAYGAYNAASVPASVSKTISIDNAPVSVSLSGPADAPSTSGTQYVHVTGVAGPSGVGAIVCSVDGGPPQRTAGSSADVAVSGIGPHRVDCYAENNALDTAGAPGTSPMQAHYMTIRQPTVAAISFTRVVNALRCHAAWERIRVPGHWVVIHHGHKLVRIRDRAHWETIRVTHCHPRTVRRQEVVWKVVRRHGRLVRIKEIRVVRVVLLPHVAGKTIQRVPFGHGTTVSGWLGFPNGTALAGQPIGLYTAPDNGQNRFKQVAVARTGADGSWSGRLPAGPSRLVVAVYNGSSTTEPAASPQIKLTVPARIRIVRIWPRQVSWGGTVHIEGFLAGGYLPPPPAGELVRLRIGVGDAYTTYGVKVDVTGTGRFQTTYTFGVGPPSIRRDYWFQLQALPEDDYAFAPADSGRATVHVGG